MYMYLYTIATLLLSKIYAILHQPQNDIALTAKSYCTNRNRASGKSIAKYQRSSRCSRESIGLYKNPSMERTASRAMAEMTGKRFEANAWASRIVDRESAASYKQRNCMATLACALIFVSRILDTQA